MAKQPETRERIVMRFETDEDNMGTFAVMLTKLGAANIGWELITETLTYKTKAHNGAVIERIKRIIDETTEGNITTKGITHTLRAEGMPIGGIYAAVDRLVEQGVLQKISSGTYRKIGGFLEGPKKATPQPAGVKAAPNQKFAVTNWETIARYANGRKTIKTMELRKLFEEQGRNVTSLSSVIEKMKNRKWLKSVSIGVYEVAGRVPYSAGGDTAKRVPQAKKSKSNGADAAMSAE